MSLSITINNINDLTDAERAVLRMIVGDKQVTLTGPTATRSFIESIAGSEDVPPQTVREVTVPKLVVGEEVAPIEPEEVFSPHTTVIPASAELDSVGLPWDKRIHSSSRAKVADGTWRKMRGVDDALVATIEAELRAVQAIPVPVAPAAPYDLATDLANDAVERSRANPTTDMLTGTGRTAPVVEVVASVPVPASSVPEPVLIGIDGGGAHDMVAPIPVPPAPAPAAPLTFADLMKHVTPMLVSGKLPQDTLLAVTAEFGLPHLAALGARPDLVEAVRARIDEVCK